MDGSDFQPCKLSIHGPSWTLGQVIAYLSIKKTFRELYIFWMLRVHLVRSSLVRHLSCNSMHPKSWNGIYVNSDIFHWHIKVPRRFAENFLKSASFGVGLDIEPARLVIEQARFGSLYKWASRPTRLGSLKSPSQLAWLASQTTKAKESQNHDLLWLPGGPWMVVVWSTV